MYFEFTLECLTNQQTKQIAINKVTLSYEFWTYDVLKSRLDLSMFNFFIALRLRQYCVQNKCCAYKAFFK